MRAVPYAVRTLTMLAMTGCIVFGMVGCSDKGDADPNAFCAAYVDAAQAGAKLTNVNGSVASFQSVTALTRTRASHATELAPKALRDDLKQIESVTVSFDDRVQKATSSAEIDDAVDWYNQNIRKLEAQSDAIASWVKTNCGVVTISTSVADTTVPNSTVP